ncbi:MAG: heme exporter protein CcmD [Rhodospirillaceae bacterium]|nr:heme exporter protein CcmD [Rhodospirillaceae bacterium]MBO44863.1 heme exporter protein CcmD [Rhodospirillaceae bacterium]|tara:strand:- start:1297 stop:1476 length:180 start_codon:yes stop_codon:yes gene_type:complete
MESLSTFLDMGGYGAFVWSAYGLAAIILIGLAIHSLIRLKRTQTMLQQIRAIRQKASDE